MIRRMREMDVNWALKLANAEGWSYSRTDMERLLALTRAGFLVIEKAAAPAGMASAVLYGKRGVIGNIVVEPRFRGKGLASSLVEACAAYLKKAGAEEIYLYSYEQRTKFYERFGFRAGDAVLTMKGRPKTAAEAQASISRIDDDMGPVASLDRELFGSDRSRLLRRLRDEAPELALLASGAGGQVEGYVFGRGARDNGYEIGPWMSAGQGCEGLLDSLLSAIPVGSQAWVSVPEKRVQAVMALSERGFKLAFKTIEMRLHDAPIAMDGRLLAICGLEKG